MIPTKEEVKIILKKHLTTEANLEHNLLVGDIMQAIARYLSKTENEIHRWYVIGALHDIDVEEYNGDILQHCVVGERILEEEKIDKDIIHTIKTHNHHLNLERKTEEEHALYSSDPLSGIIRAYVLMRPDKDIANAEIKSIMKKYKDKFFASAVSRQQIALIEEKLNIPLEKIIEISLIEIKKEGYKI